MKDEHQDARLAHAHTRWSRVLGTAIVAVIFMIVTLGWKSLDNNRAITSDPATYAEYNRHEEERQREDSKRNIENDIHSELQSDKHRDATPAPAPAPANKDGDKIKDRNQKANDAVKSKYSAEVAKGGKLLAWAFNYSGPNDGDITTIVFMVEHSKDCIAPFTYIAPHDEFSATQDLNFIHTAEAVCQDAALQADVRANGLPINIG